MKRALLAGCGLLVVVASWRVHASGPLGAIGEAQAQTPAPAPQAASSAAATTDEGIPVTSDLVRRVCGDCHKSDAKGRMTRISYRRTTPEGWQETIRRMVTLNKADIDPADARAIVKYLADRHGLAPEEAKEGAFEVERRMIDYHYAGDTETERICSSCHSMGRVILQRRTGTDWEQLVAMHRGWYPLVDFQVFRRNGPPSTEPGPNGRPPDNRHPMDKAIGHLKGAFPLVTPEWDAWSATMRSPRIEGVWAVNGWESGEGPFFGRVTIKAGAAPDEFTTDVSYTYARSGRTVARAGRSVIYTGFQWRGRTMVNGDDQTSLREVMVVDREWKSIAGRWFMGAYDELGADVTLTRIGPGPVVTGLDRPAVPRSGTAQPVRIYGENFPASLAPGDVDFGPGITVRRVVSSTPALVTVEVDVAATAAIGPRDLFIAGASRRAALTVYERIDYIKVGPTWGMARVGGNVFPKMVAQFDAFGYSNGPDNKPDTKDDINVGLVTAQWSVEEYTATFNDDDVKFVGEINAATGRFMPALDGPNPARSGNRNNIGDVWVVATHAPGGTATPLRARAHLVVTVPLYMRWDFFSLSQR
jgi:quinohemoprotein amine dehydrogenase